MDDGEARHIGGIIRERGRVFQAQRQIIIERQAKDRTTRAGDPNHFIMRVQKMLRSALDGVVWVPVTIGRVVTLPLTSKRVASWTSRFTSFW
jgi:hypothetical protein